MMGEIIIREAREEDVPALAAIYAADEFGHGDSADPQFLPLYLNAFRKISESDAETLYVAEGEDGIVGTFQTLMTRTLTGRGRLSMIVEAVQTRPDQRGKGVGAKMMAFAIENARAQGAALVQLTSNTRRTDAHRFYERLGFVKSHAGFKMKLDG